MTCGEDPVLLVKIVKDRPEHDRRYAIIPERSGIRLGFVPHETLSSGLQKTVEWYVSNQEWWRAVMDGTCMQWLKTNYRSSE